MPNKYTNIKAGILIAGSLCWQNSFSQVDSLVENHNPETLWYLQKETWIVGAMLFVIILIGFFYRASKFKRKTPKKITTVTHTIIKPAEKQEDEEKL